MTTHSLDEAVDRILDRLARTAAEQDPGFPHFADATTGAWTRTPTGDWTGAFFVGQLWLAAAVTPDQRWHQLALDWAERLAPRATSQTVFRGFLFWYGAAIGAVLLDDQRAARIALDGAEALAASFHPRGRLLPLGVAAEDAHSVGPEETNIDGVPGGAPLLFFAADQTGDAPARPASTSPARALDEYVTGQVLAAVAPAALEVFPVRGRPGRGGAGHHGHAVARARGRRPLVSDRARRQYQLAEPESHLVVRQLAMDWGDRDGRSGPARARIPAVPRHPSSDAQPGRTVWRSAAAGLLVDDHSRANGNVSRIWRCVASSRHSSSTRLARRAAESRSRFGAAAAGNGTRSYVRLPLPTHDHRGQSTDQGPAVGQPSPARCCAVARFVTVASTATTIAPAPGSPAPSYPTSNGSRGALGGFHPKAMSNARPVRPIRPVGIFRARIIPQPRYWQGATERSGAVGRAIDAGCRRPPQRSHPA